MINESGVFEKQDSANLTDEELAELVKQGERSAFAILVRKNTTKFYRIAFGILHSKEDAEDVVQECFLKFWQDPFKWNGKKQTKFSTWFYRVIVNKCFDQLRKSKELPLEENFDIVDQSQNVENILEQNQQNQILGLAYKNLNPRQKTAITLSFFEQKKNHESAQIMGLGLKAFQSLLLRSKATLKQEFQKLGGIYE